MAAGEGEASPSGFGNTQQLKIYFLGNDAKTGDQSPESQVLRLAQWETPGCQGSSQSPQELLYSERQQASCSYEALGAGTRGSTGRSKPGWGWGHSQVRHFKLKRDVCASIQQPPETGQTLPPGVVGGGGVPPLSHTNYTHTIFSLFLGRGIRT